MKTNMLRLLIITLMAGKLCAQEPVIYRDVSPGIYTSSFNFSGHYYFKASDGRIYFGARDSASGPEDLCYIDTDDKFVTLFRAGDFDYGYFDEMAELNGEIFFAFGTNATGNELWKTDGTEAGTVLVKDIEPGVTGSSPRNFTPFGGKLYFLTPAGKLYVTDGTESGTIEISNGETVTDLIVSGSTLFVNAANTANGNELFKINSGGTALELVKDIIAGTAGSNVQDFTPFNSGLLFAAGSAVAYPYFTDGTAAGTIQLSDSVQMIKTGIEFNGLGYFYGRVDFPQSASSIYSTDGSAGSVVEEVPGAVYDVIVAGETQFFFSGRVSSSPYGIYVSEGQGSNTDKIIDAKFSDAQAVNLLDYIGYAVFDDVLYFIGDSVGTSNGRAELFVTDGTVAGSVMYDIDPSQDDAGYNRCFFLERDGAIYMTLQDSAHGLEPWCIGCTPDNGMDSTNSIAGIESDMSLKLYPNPAQDRVWISSSSTSITAIAVYDLLGNTVKSVVGTGKKEEIDLSNLPSGSYIVHAQDDLGNKNVSRLVVFH